MAGTSGWLSRQTTLLVLLAAAIVWPAQSARADITSPKDGHTYVIPPDTSYVSDRLDWSYALPNPQCTDGYAGVSYYQTTPGLGEAPNGGGTLNGPFSEEAQLDWAIPGEYTGRTTWTCTIDAPPLGHPMGDYNLFDQPLDTISYSVRRWGEEVPKGQGVVPGPGLSPGPTLSYTKYKESVLRLVCLKTDQDCYAKGRVILDGLERVISPGSTRQAARHRGSTWITIGTGRFSLAREPETSVTVPLEREARRALKRLGSLKVRVTVRASVEGGPPRTVRQGMKLKLAKPGAKQERAGFLALTSASSSRR